MCTLLSDSRAAIALGFLAIAILGCSKVLPIPGAAPTSESSTGLSLHEAVTSARYEDIQALIAGGANVDGRRDGLTPLHLAIQMGRADVAKLLIECGADVNARDSDGRTPLHYAALQGQTSTAEALLAHGADVNAVDYHGLTVLQAAGGGDSGVKKAGIEPGMLVCIDPENPGALTICTLAYDRTVVGIISGAGNLAPGMHLSASNDTLGRGHPVALSGRVYCWADATAAPIRPGDFLTTSNTPGHAMKVTDYARAQGAIVGKAMSPLEEGKGLVLVFVSLQ